MVHCPMTICQPRSGPQRAVPHHRTRPKGKIYRMPAVWWDGRGRSESTMESLFPRLNAEYDLLPRVRGRGTRRARQLSQAAATVA